VTNIPSACRIANIALNDAMILPYNANPGRIEFSERTGILFGMFLFCAVGKLIERSLSASAPPIAVRRPPDVRVSGSLKEDVFDERNDCEDDEDQDD